MLWPPDVLTSIQTDVVTFDRADVFTWTSKPADGLDVSYEHVIPVETQQNCKLASAQSQKRLMYILNEFHFHFHILAPISIFVLEFYKQ